MVSARDPGVSRGDVVQVVGTVPDFESELGIDLVPAPAARGLSRLKLRRCLIPAVAVAVPGRSLEAPLSLVACRPGPVVRGRRRSRRRGEVADRVLGYQGRSRTLPRGRHHHDAVDVRASAGIGSIEASPLEYLVSSSSHYGGVNRWRAKRCGRSARSLSSVGAAASG